MGESRGGEGPEGAGLYREGRLSCPWDIKKRILCSAFYEEREDCSRGERPGSFGTDQEDQGEPSILGVSAGKGVVGASGEDLGQREEGS